MKRLFDVVASGVGLLLLSPLFLLVAIWIKLDSPGPVFYRQVRVGRYNRDFRIFKFRSMRVGADKGSLVTIGGRDPRVTRSGYFIRKFKIDELPQLINVFIGDMSLVGPRPEVRHYVNYWTKEQLHVLDVRPGITDPASIKFRNENELLEKAEDPEKYYIEVIMQEKLRLYLKYVEKHNFWYDIKLIFQTSFQKTKGLAYLNRISSVDDLRILLLIKKFKTSGHSNKILTCASCSGNYHYRDIVCHYQTRGFLLLFIAFKANS